ncbi:tetratricopeptide repeat protein [Dactylosporangium sp. NPDC048998]|uniref:tetratricopeptide repeat protein n=1 Tax=Dactylosporangium sp. NPDC048998 TaxID=3363976 RepID=UPI0037170D73
MKAADLARRFRTYDGWLPPAVADRLAEHGHLDELRRLAERGDWCCADRLARALFERHEPEVAMRVLRPFVDTGWWQAVEVLVDFHDRRGETDAAIALVRGALDKGSPHGIERLAVLLAKRGRVDEAVVLLRPYAGEDVVLDALVELTEGHGYDGELTALVREQIEADSPVRLWNAAAVLATLLERQGQVDEALEVLTGSAFGEHAVFVNAVEQLADILARHGRERQLRGLVAGGGGEHAVFRLAVWLESLDRVDEAVEAMRPFAADGSPNVAAALAELLTRHGRADEAIEVLRPVPRLMGGDPEWLVGILCKLLVERGRADEALAAIDDLAAHSGGIWIELLFERVEVLARSGRVEQAIAELGAHPEGGTWYGTSKLAGLLVLAGRPGEAIRTLESADDSAWTTAELAVLLIDQGRVEEALALFAPEEAPKSEEGRAFWRRFHREGRVAGIEPPRAADR